MGTVFTCIPNLGKEGGGTVWDPTENKTLAVFDQFGEYETSDKAVAAKLKDMGFKEIKTKTPAPKPKIRPAGQKPPRNRPAKTEQPLPAKIRKTMPAAETSEATDDNDTE